jgi:hypothetical protein
MNSSPKLFRAGNCFASSISTRMKTRCRVDCTCAFMVMFPAILNKIEDVGLESRIGRRGVRYIRSEHCLGFTRAESGQFCQYCQPSESGGYRFMILEFIAIERGQDLSCSSGCESVEACVCRKEEHVLPCRLILSGGVCTNMFDSSVMPVEPSEVVYASASWQHSPLARTASSVEVRYSPRALTISSNPTEPV